MNSVLEFLSGKVYYLATVDGDQPHVRPMGFIMEYDGKLCGCTGNPKPMFKQMQANPKIELCVFDGAKTLRVQGTAKVIPGQEAKEKALAVMPALKDIYAIDDGIFEIFAIENATATFSTMTEGVIETINF